jgi:pimeloyl-ACP methyl ester carboxylesterase
VFNDPPWVPWPAGCGAGAHARAPGRLRAVGARPHRPRPEALLLGTRLGRIAVADAAAVVPDDGVIDASAVDAFRAGIRDNRVVLLDRCGHMPMMVKPRVVAAALDAFARKPMRVRRGPQTLARLE